MVKKPRTVLKTIRISEATEEFLRKDASLKKSTTNALIQTILTKYLEWDRFAERYGFVSTTHETFKAMVDGLDHAKVVEIGRELGGRIPREIVLFWFGRSGVNGFLKYLELVSEYAALAQIEIKRQLPNYTVTLHHSFGEKWSTFLKNFLEAGLKATTGIEGEVEVVRATVVLTFAE